MINNNNFIVQVNENCHPNNRSNQKYLKSYQLDLRQVDLQQLLLITKRGKFNRNSVPRFAPNQQQNQNSNVLDLTHTKIESIPSFQYRDIKILNLSDNFIKTFKAEELLPLAQLENLLLRNNLLQDFSFLNQWRNTLKVLDISQNHIKIIRPEIAQMKKLQQLYIAHNNFTELPFEFTMLKKSLNVLQLDWMLYSNPSSNELIDDKKQLEHFITILEEIILDIQISSDQQNSTVHFTQIITHPSYQLYTQKYMSNDFLSRQDSKSLSVNRSMEEIPLKKSQVLSNQQKQNSYTDKYFERNESRSLSPIRKNKNGKQNLFHRAVINEDLGVLRILIEEDGEKKLINQIDEEGHSPLSLAILEEKYLAAKYLLFSNANPNIGGLIIYSIIIKRSWLGSCLNIALSKLQYFLVRDLLLKGASVSKLDQFQNDAIHYLFTIFQMNEPEAKKLGYLLLEFGANPNRRNANGMTPIHMAIQKQNLPALKFSIEYNQNVIDLDQNPKFSFKHKTLKEKNSGIEQVIIYIKKALHLAVLTKQIEIVQIVLSLHPEQVFQRNQSNLTPTDYLKDDLTIFKILQAASKSYLKKMTSGRILIIFNCQSSLGVSRILSPQSSICNNASISTLNSQFLSQLVDPLMSDEIKIDSYQENSWSPSSVSQREIATLKITDNKRNDANEQREQIHLQNLTRSIPFSPNNLQLLEEQCQLLMEMQTTKKKQKNEYFQAKSRLVKEIAYELKQINQNSFYYIGLMKEDLNLSERVAQSLIIKRIYFMLNKLLEIVSKEEAFQIQWKKFINLQFQNKGKDQLQMMDLKDSINVDTYSTYTKINKNHFSRGLIQLFNQLNKKLETQFEQYYMNFKEQSFSNRERKGDEELFNNYLINSFLSPHNGFGLQRIILFINTKDNMSIILDQRNGIINLFDLCLNKLQLAQSAPTNYRIMNQKLFLKFFNENLDFPQKRINEIKK